MQVFKFLALSASALTLSSISAYANDEYFSKNNDERPLRSRSAERDLLVHPGLQTATNVIKSKEILEADYKELAKIQKKQRIAAKKDRIERNKKLKMIANLPAEVDTLSAAKLMEILFMYPEAKNRKLTKALMKKADALSQEGPRQFLNDAERKANYIISLDVLLNQVQQDHNYWELDKYGYRQAVRPKRVSAQEVFKISGQEVATEQTVLVPQIRKFAEKKQRWDEKKRAHAVAA